jgi:hypothetical protein
LTGDLFGLALQQFEYGFLICATHRFAIDRADRSLAYAVDGEYRCFN